MARSSNPKAEPPMCTCGHDIFFHDIKVLQHNSEGDATQVTVGKCNENDGEHYTCKCTRFNTIDTWMNQLWEEMKKYAL